MRNWKWLLVLGLAGVALVSLNVRAEGEAEAKKEEKARGSRGGVTSPEGLARLLTGELALTEEQTTKIKDAYAKIVQPVLDNAAAAKKEGKDMKTAFREMRPAFEKYTEELKKILTEAQLKKVEEARAATRTKRGEGAKPQVKEEPKAPPPGGGQ